MYNYKSSSLCQQPSLENLKEKCLDVLDSKEHVKTLESLITRYTNQLYDTNNVLFHDLPWWIKINAYTFKLCF